MIFRCISSRDPLPRATGAQLSAGRSLDHVASGALFRVASVSTCSPNALPALADDSGLEVDFLNGAPGIYSARYAGENANDAANNQKLLDALKNVPVEKRSARFVCVLVYMRHANDPMPLICRGSWQGRILEQPDGDGGFGYDPLFFVPDLNLTAARLSKTEKNAISHRGQALSELKARFIQ